MADEAVAAPPAGTLGKLADMFDQMADSANTLVVKLAPLKVTPSNVWYGADFRNRFDDRLSKFSAKVESLRKDFHDIGDQLRKVELSYQDTEIDNKDDIERLRGLVDKLKARNPGIEKIMPVLPQM